ncbi:DUF3267 domain-containing protein [Aliifodinibius sp. S!AR15-10]|uniref:DUF3267 domain-containing protein n=1 Tax=Aliifodinibius sp. S!AR15-10 TaxID=2950437 RepID=UPI002866F13C|nr:DUF3267 domain-containing protein [Aliifodinibius sp. S!AR15-10]MDR8393152.1 DUF3267 domain-containing protein [Aliifodinibius sp. S!AR15-10]
MSSDDYSISMVKANLISVGLFIPLSLLFLIPYGMIWGARKTGSDLTLFYQEPLFFIFLMIVGVIAHELLHGFTWICLGDKSWSSIRFGVNWKALAPYAHCVEPVEISAYRWGAAMPGIVLGLLPFLAGMATGSGWFILFGYMLAITASGDLLILWITRGLKSGTLVQDHPERVGCQVVDMNYELRMKN